MSWHEDMDRAMDDHPEWFVGEPVDDGMMWHIVLRWAAMGLMIGFILGALAAKVL